MVSVPQVLLDTSVLLNLLASGEIESIFRTLNNRWLICAAVEKESLYLRTDDPHNPFEPVTLVPLFSAKLLEVCDVESGAEAQLYVNYSTQLDDGEAMSMAIAVSRGYYLATDDRKARHIFLETNLAEGLWCTSKIVREWIEREALSSAKARHVLFEIIRKARFFPPASDENLAWWSDLCS